MEGDRGGNRVKPWMEGDRGGNRVKSWMEGHTGERVSGNCAMESAANSAGCGRGMETFARAVMRDGIGRGQRWMRPREAGLAAGRDARAGRGAAGGTHPALGTEESGAEDGRCGGAFRCGLEGERDGAAGIAAMAARRMSIDVDGRSAGGRGDGR
jgi:hypothetical protein